MVEDETDWPGTSLRDVTYLSSGGDGEMTKQLRLSSSTWIAASSPPNILSIFALAR